MVVKIYLKTGKTVDAFNIESAKNMEEVMNSVFGSSFHFLFNDAYIIRISEISLVEYRYDDPIPKTISEEMKE